MYSMYMNLIAILYFVCKVVSHRRYQFVYDKLHAVNGFLYYTQDWKGLKVNVAWKKIPGPWLT